MSPHATIGLGIENRVTCDLPHDVWLDLTAMHDGTYSYTFRGVPPQAILDTIAGKEEEITSITIAPDASGRVYVENLVVQSPITHVSFANNGSK